MDEIQLGDGRMTSRIGFGCGRLVGGVSAGESARLVEAALALGIRHFDVAPSYGLGSAEDVLGSVIKTNRDAVTVATKVGIARPSAPGVLALARKQLAPVARALPVLKRALLGGLAKTGSRNRFAPSDVEASFKGSLKHLACDRVDILLLHHPRRDDLTPELEELCAAWVKDGRVRFYGVGTNEERDHVLNFGSVRQFRWNPTGTADLSDQGLSIQHGVLRFGLDRLKRAIGTKPDQVTRWCQDTGFDLRHDAGQAAFLLTAALAADPNAIVLVSTKDPERLRACITGLNWDYVRNPAPSLRRVLLDVLCPTECYEL